MREVRYPYSGGAWLHYLHGNVPGHQLDWIARPHGLPGGVTPQHVQHLLDIIQVHDVPGPSEHNLTFANLSLKDTTHRPGLGGMAVVAHFRLPSSLDHGGRKNPRFVHALVSVGQALDPHAVHLAATGLLQGTVDDAAAPDRPVDHWYGAYLAAAEAGPDAALEVLQAYFDSFPPMPVVVGASEIERWSLTEGAILPREVLVRCGPRTPETLRQAVTAMSGLASVLYHARLPWAAVTTGAGRGSDDGVVVRFAFSAPGAPEDGLALADLPDDPVELAFSLLPLEEEREQRFVPVSRWVNPATGERVMTSPRAPTPPPISEDTSGEGVSAVPAAVPPEDAGVEEGPPAITTLPPPPESWPPPPASSAPAGALPLSPALPLVSPAIPAAASPSASSGPPPRPPSPEPRPAHRPHRPPPADAPPVAGPRPAPTAQPTPGGSRPRVWLSLLVGGSLGALVLAGALAFIYREPKPKPGPRPSHPIEAVAPQPEAPAPQPEAPAAQPETPAPQPETTAPQPETPAVQPETPTSAPSTSGTTGSKSAGKAGKAAKATSGATGTVVVAGDAREVRLDNKALSAGSNPVAPGRYRLSARFPDLDELQRFGEVTVTADRTTTVRCSSATYTCSAAR